MLKHNILLAFRHLKRFKGTTLINLLGLSTGLACVLLIYLWVNDELSMDKFHKNGPRLYQIMEHHQTSEGIIVGEHTSGLLAEVLAEEMPEVEYATAIRLRNEQKILSVGNVNIRGLVLFASPDFFKVFSYDLIQGNKEQALNDKSGIILSESLASKLFNSTTEVLGKVVEFDHSKQFSVVGMFPELPANSSMKFDFILPFELYKEIDPNVLNWNYNTTKAYVVLKEGSSQDAFNNKLEHFLEDKRQAATSTLTTRLYSDSYLHGNYENGRQTGGRIEYVVLFSLVGAFILLIACINFMNLSTAKASRRLREVGVKKVIGASRNTLIYQYLGESMLMVVVSLMIALLLILVVLPPFNLITGKQLSLHFDFGLISSILVTTLLTGIVAGSYPAFYLSGFKPAKILKGKFRSPLSEAMARQGLVAVQFTLSIILIVSVLVVYNQIEYVQTKNLGYDREQVIQFDIEGEVAGNLETFLQEAVQIPGVVKASGIGQSIVDGQNTFTIDSWQGKPDNITFPAFQMRPVTFDLFETLGIQLKEGRGFSRDYNTEGSKIIFNEAAIKLMGLENPVGQEITIQGTNLEIIGVVGDFHFASLHQQVGPLFFVYQPTWTHKVVMKISPGKEQETLGYLEEFYQTFNPGYSFNYIFLDQEYEALYAAEQRVAVLSKYFTVLAVLISCLGLFGLAAFTAERRQKEIGIRKILGSSVFELVKLLNADFTRVVLVAILIALPLSYLIAHNWLDTFAYRIDLHWWLFGLAGGLALIIAWLTVGLQTIKAALANPVESLRSE